MLAKQAEIDPKRFTVNDINVGSRLYDVLVAHAVKTGGEPVFYSDVLEAARNANPQDDEVLRAVPIGIGMKLLFAEAFCTANNYPNLACLAVNKATGRPGPGYRGNWEQDRKDVAAFNWSVAKPHLNAFVVAATAAVTPPKRLKADAAAKVLYKHYVNGRDRYKTFDQQDKEEMKNLLMEGFDVEPAFNRVLEAKQSEGII